MELHILYLNSLQLVHRLNSFHVLLNVLILSNVHCFLGMLQMW